MALLAAVAYDPSTAVIKSTTTAIAMTAIDTSNARVTFTAPANGAVLVRLLGTTHGATTSPQILLGVLDGATVRGRSSGISIRQNNSAATTPITKEANFLVTGLTPSTSYTWDAAYGVESGVASGLKYGGPNDAVGNDAFGALVFEVWEAKNLIAGVNYDPSTAVTTKSIATLIALTALDTTNLRLTFTAPASGNVLIRIACISHGGSGVPAIVLGVLEGSTIRGRVAAGGVVADLAGAQATSHIGYQAQFMVTGLTPGNSYSYDAAYGVQVAVASAAIKYGGPNDATFNNAFGGFAYEVWAA